MSGIYIPGVTVPEDNTILLRIYPESDGKYYTEQIDIDEDILDKYFAIPVPEHGRCIDADALMKKGMPLSFSVQKWVQEVDIACAPTIIPASGGDAE